MQHQEQYDTHSFRLHGPLNKIERIAEPKSPAAQEVLEQEERIAEAFTSDGFFVLKQCFDKNILLLFREFVNAYFDKCIQDLYDHGHIESPTYLSREILSDKVENDQDANQQRNKYTMQKGLQHGFREIVMRSPGRFELSLLHFDREESVEQKNKETMFRTYRLDENIPLLIEPLKSLLPRLVGPNYTSYEELKLCYVSLIIATPGSSDQSWHVDGGHASTSKHLPCHCFNVFIPLQDTPKALGPTELRPGTQFLTRNLGPMMLAARCRKTLKPPVWPELEFGDAIIFDYRVLHRGRANLSNHSLSPGGGVENIEENNKKTMGVDRNYLVLCYCEPWFKDILNFPPKSLYDPK
jgi:hypothetical protein